MKKPSFKILCIVISFLLALTLIPAFAKRVNNEKKNNNITVSVYYNDLYNRLTTDKMHEALEDFYAMGVTNVTVSPENVNSMVARGAVTNIKFNSLRHKYDEESIELAELIEAKYPLVGYDSQLLITKDPETAAFLDKNLPEHYSDKEYVKIETGNDITCYSIFDGSLQTNEILIGYEESALQMLTDMGFDITMVMKVQNFKNTGYLATLGDYVKKYNVKFANIRKGGVEPENKKEAKANYEGIAKIIKDNDLVLVLSENANQLSNEKTLGFNEIFKDNHTKVVRAYETYDASNADKTKYMFRYQQYLNSTINRNIRFITVSQIHLSKTDYNKLNEYTQAATKEYIEKVKSLGYTVNEDPAEFDYDVDRKPINAIAAAIMVFLAYYMFMALTGIEKNKKLHILCIALAVFAFGVTFVMPGAVRNLYPTLWAVLAPCFGLTVTFEFVEYAKDKLHALPLCILTCLFAAAVMSACGVVLASLVSGIDYYVNNEIFRGIKISLFVPLLYGAVLSARMYLKFKKSFAEEVKSVANASIKVYWIVIAAVLGYVALTYIRRSGNVNTISSIETLMRNFITDKFTARPRTKEFLVGYPCLLLFAYYVKKVRIGILNVLLGAGSGILTASISNSFCHVFTEVSTVYMRVVNGIVIAALVCAVAYVANLVLIAVVKWGYNRFFLPAAASKKED